mgnify:CR=1 FL=1
MRGRDRARARTAGASSCTMRRRRSAVARAASFATACRSTMASTCCSARYVGDDARRGTCSCGNVASPWITAPLAIRPLSAQQRNALIAARAKPSARRSACSSGCCAHAASRGASASRRSAGSRHCDAREFRCADGATVADIIAPLPPHVRDNLWAPLCVAALNTPPTEASAQVFLNVLREAFGGAANAAQMVVARSGLARAFPEQAADWLRARGHAVGSVVAAAGDRRRRHSPRRCDRRRDAPTRPSSP